MYVVVLSAGTSTITIRPTRNFASASPRTVKLTASQARNLKKLDNIIENHAKPHDFSGVKRDLAGDPVPKPGGGFYNHIHEMRDSVAGLKRVIRRLERSLDNPKLDPAVRAVLEEAIDRGKAVLQKMQATLNGTGP